LFQRLRSFAQTSDATLPLPDLMSSCKKKLLLILRTNRILTTHSC
jgi:hypothetical protein